MTSLKIKRLINCTDKLYKTIYIREKRYGTLQYFNKVNSYKIDGRYIDEKKLFNISDYYYINKIIMTKEKITMQNRRLADLYGIDINIFNTNKLIRDKLNILISIRQDILIKANLIVS